MRKYILLVLVVVIASVLYFNPEKDNLSLELDGSAKVNLFSPSCLDSLNRIQFIKEGASQELVFSETIKTEDLLVRRSKWLLKQPFLAPANDERVAQVISAFRDLHGEVDKSAPSSDSQGQYGLVPPDGVIVLECGGSKEILSIGTKNELSGNRYYQKEGDSTLYLVRGNFLESLVLTLGDIRAKKILAFDPESIEGIEVVEGTSFYALNKNSEGDWLITSNGKKFEGDKLFIAKELKDLVNINISRIFDNPLDILPLTGLDQPVLILNLKIRGSKDDSKSPLSELIIQFGKGLLGEMLNKKQVVSAKQPHYLKITKDNAIYELERSYIADWLQGPSHFRQRSVFESLDKSKLTSASLEVGNISCGLEGQHILKDQILFDNLTKGLDALRFDAFLDLSELDKYPKAEGLKAQFQFGSKIVSINRLANVLSEIDSKTQRVASILEINEVGKDSYYGSISSDRMDLIEDIFKELCSKGKSSEKPI